MYKIEITSRHNFYDLQPEITSCCYPVIKLKFYNLKPLASRTPDRNFNNPINGRLTNQYYLKYPNTTIGLASICASP